MVLQFAKYDLTPSWYNTGFTVLSFVILMAVYFLVCPFFCDVCFNIL